jgi:hypothetical protein
MQMKRLNSLALLLASQWSDKMKKLSVVFMATLISLASASAFAHGGGTDSKGCHTDHKTGGYHCH